MQQALELSKSLYIGGKFVAPALGGTFENMRPTTGALLCNVAHATKEDIDLAVTAARACLEGDTWGYKSTGAQRAVILRRLAEIFTERKEDIATIDSVDHGKPIREARADVDDAIDACGHFADLAEKQDKDQDEVVHGGPADDFTARIRHEPIGVVGAITPWNYPFLMGIWKVVPAIAAGCTIVLKPSELAPLSCLLLGQLTQEAGLPAGALNVVPGLGHTAGAALTDHSGIDKISFTGSVPTAQRVMAACAKGPRGVSLELGGKSPLIIFDDVENLEGCVDWC